MDKGLVMNLRLYDGYKAHIDAKPAVKALQEKLNLLPGYSLVADGEFGRLTEEAVKRFQKQNGMDPDGVVTDAVYAKLLQLTASKPPKNNTVDTTPINLSSAMIKLLSNTIPNIIKYKEHVIESSKKFNIDPYIVCGIGSRESCWLLCLKPPTPDGTGDFIKRSTPRAWRSGPLPPDGKGFGRGLMQIDYDAHEFARTGDWSNVRSNIMYGCNVLEDARKYLAKKLNLTGLDLLRASIAAYNCGPGNVEKAITKYNDPDYFTYGRDYSKDVLNRTKWYSRNEQLKEIFK